MPLKLTPENERAMYKRVMEYAEKGRWADCARIMGGNPREDLQDYIPGLDDGEGPRGAPNFA